MQREKRGWYLAHASSGLVSLGMLLALVLVLWNDPFSATTGAYIALAPIALGIALGYCITDNTLPERRWLRAHWLEIVQLLGACLIVMGIWSSFGWVYLHWNPSSTLLALGYCFGIVAQALWWLIFDSLIDERSWS